MEMMAKTPQYVLTRQVAYIKKRKAIDPAFKARRAELHREHNIRLRQLVLDGYGGKCACCGEAERVFLCLDHVNGGGNQHRKSKGFSTSGLYRHVRDLGFPKEFQLLYHNCNFAKWSMGKCPHQVE